MNQRYIDQPRQDVYYTCKQMLEDDAHIFGIILHISEIYLPSGAMSSDTKIWDRILWYKHSRW